MRLYYFGCRGGSGHCLWTHYGVRLGSYGPDFLPWTAGELDGPLAPPDSQKQAPALIHHRDGWTALAFWDRTGDERDNSNSVVLAEGTHNFATMVAIMRKHLPWLAERLTFELVEAAVLPEVPP